VLLGSPYVQYGSHDKSTALVQNVLCSAFGKKQQRVPSFREIRN
jgi:hypothetical protein